MQQASAVGLDLAGELLVEAEAELDRLKEAGATPIKLGPEVLRTASAAMVALAVTLHGQQGSDRYEIGLAGEISSRINVFDQSQGDPGINRLRIFGTNQVDFFLLRANKDIGQGMVAAIEVDADRVPVAGGVIERINYDGDISGAVEIFGRDGNDTFVFDDTLAPVTAFGDAGDDTFQIGQVFQSFRDGRNPDNGLAEEDYFETTQITRGFLSNGVSQSTTLFGGTGRDNFTVYRNLAELFLFGDEDDDTFTVRAFVKVDPNDPKAPFTNINGGQGADFVAFTVNAPVRIDGGDGFDTLTVIGTEFGDDFVVTDKGVFGAGLFIRGWLLQVLGNALFQSGDNEGACDTMEEAIDYAERQRLVQCEVHARAVLACARTRLGLPEAASNLDHALELARRQGDPWAEILVLRGLAELKPSRAGLDFLEQACELARRHEIAPELARSLMALGLRRRRAKAAGAEECLAEAARLAAAMKLRDVQIPEAGQAAPRQPEPVATM